VIGQCAEEVVLVLVEALFLLGLQLAVGLAAELGVGIEDQVPAARRGFRQHRPAQLQNAFPLGTGKEADVQDVVADRERRLRPELVIKHSV
jgi:hypothetical protein